MRAADLMKSARKAERNSNDLEAEELYSQVITEFPDSDEAREARFDLEDLAKKREFKPEPVQPNPKQNDPEVVITQVKGNVAIVDFNMPFWSMVIFMVKAAIASIPALMILSIIGAVITGVLGDMLGGSGRY